MQDLSKEESRALARCLGPTIRMALSDKVPGVYLASVSLLKMLAGSGILPAKECSAVVADTTPALIEKVLHPKQCHNNASTMCHACGALACLHVRPSGCCEVFCRRGEGIQREKHMQKKQRSRADWRFPLGAWLSDACTSSQLFIAKSGNLSQQDCLTLPY